ncbi:MAG: hypothetical protein JNL61_18015 [Rhizobiaceae bacterium]|nr:hypothetical protein [Rhizobiaceae bacterium]
MRSRAWAGATAIAVLIVCVPCGGAFALSEIQRETLPAPATTPEAPPADTDVQTPADQDAPADAEPQDDIDPDEGAPDEADTPPDPNRPHISQDGPPPEVFYDVSVLPEPVRRMRDLLLEATHKADIEALRPLLGSGDSMTQLSLGGLDGDPIQFLKDLSGDEQGHEILAIIEEVLSAGYVHLDVGTPNELYVWPYFFALPIDNMTPRQRVELFKIVTAGDYEDMKAFGAYIFYRVGITPEGRWAFFVAGD